MTFSEDPLVESWRTCRPLSDHLRLEIAHAVHTGHRPGDPPPLEEGAPVPGCGCEDCTGVRRRARTGSGPPGPGTRRPLPVEDARRVSILDVVARLGLGEPEGRWGEPKVRCPFHDDHDPSLRLNVDDGLFYCDPCCEGGDAIDLYQQVRGVTFADAVRELAGP